MAWIKLPAVSVANGDIVVSVTGSVDLSSVLSGWALIINSNYVEIKSGTSADGNGNSTLTLAEPWDGSTITNQPAKIMPTSAPALEIAQLMTDTNEFAIAVHNALEEYAMQDKDITLEAPNGETATFASLPKTERVMQAFRDAAGTAYAYDVTESAMDSTENRLLKVGNGGLLGKCPVITIDWRTALNSVNTTLPTFLSSATSENAPESGKSHYPQVLAYDGVNPYRTIVAWPYENSSSIYITSRTGLNWSNWKKLLDTGNTGSIVTEDYEEGTWTPSIRGSSGGEVIDCSVAKSGWTKIGREIKAWAYVTNVDTANANLNGIIRIYGIPFPSAGVSGSCRFIFQDIFSNELNVVNGYLFTNFVSLTKGSIKSSVDDLSVHLGTGLQYMIEITYYV